MSSFSSTVQPDEDDAPETSSDIEDENTPEETASPAEAESRSQPAARIELQPSDFYFGITLGEGAYARVVHAKSKKTGDQFAVKIMEKVHIKKENKIKNVLMERKILTMVSHPFIVKFHFSFQDAGYLYMCMDLIPGGILLDLIITKTEEQQAAGEEERGCDLATTQFYIAEIVEGLRYLHTLDIIHRDLKPENILITTAGHVKITDFGTATILSDHEDPRNSFVGTQDYVSPEVLSGDRMVTRACDLWALGCMIYQMLCGRSPFREPTEYLTFEAIMGHCKGNKPLEYPNSIDAVSRDIIGRLLQGAEADRLGCASEDVAEGYSALRGHGFFSTTDWEGLYAAGPPFVPDVTRFPSSDNMRDGATNQWLLEGEPTPIAPAVHRSDINKPEKVQSKSTAGSVWDQFLVDGERQVFTSSIYKRKGLFSKRRQLILTDAPRLVYVDPHSMEIKGEIPWTKANPVSCSVKNSKEFDVHCSVSQRSYHLTDNDVGSQTWVDHINAMLRQQAEEP